MASSKLHFVTFIKMTGVKHLTCSYKDFMWKGALEYGLHERGSTFWWNGGGSVCCLQDA
jgi:hypothetical protein